MAKLVKRLARGIGRSFTRTILAGFVVKSPTHDGFHDGVFFFFQGGRTVEGEKYTLDAADAGMTEENAEAAAQFVTRKLRIPDGETAVCGLTIKGAMPDGSFREAYVTNNSGQWGERSRTPIARIPAILPRPVVTALILDILSRCSSPFGAADEVPADEAGDK